MRADALILAGLASLTGGCSYSSEQLAQQRGEQAAELSRALDGRVAGEPRQCMPLSNTGGPQVIGDGVVLYRETGRTTWLARVEGECPSLRPDVVLITEPTGGQLCRNDRFRTVDRVSDIPSAYCRFGSFTPYERK